MVNAPRRVAFVFIALSLCSSPCHAYIDPGTGSALVYVVTGVVVSFFFAARALYHRSIELIVGLGTKKHTCHLAIHSEDPRYEITFLPILRGLAVLGVETTYFTMYERTQDFEPLPSGIAHIAIEPGMVGYSYLSHLRARVLATTTPQLDVMTFRRSKAVAHYVHLQHALGEALYVRPYSYDFFDSIFCCGETLRTNIRKIEFVRKLPYKNLYEIGVPHYDELLALSPSPELPTHLPTERPVVLVAPSWGPLSIFETLGTSFLETLTDSFRVVVRPHPQMRHSQPVLYQEILGLDKVEVDISKTPMPAMAKADVLLSDISGIMHEFAFILEKPVVFLRQSPASGMDGQLFGGLSTLQSKSSKFLVPIAAEEIGSLADRLAELLEQDRSELAKVRDGLVYNFGQAGEAAARQLSEILADHD
ncbi:MAG: CDP-glycerol glycerophosphotransferase family protein [Thermoanaerobaculia bacterium]|nr:CDP-glycerol glycerophosphotransferase family protein [Thermoanaerobaculia bacterium]